MKRIITTVLFMIVFVTGCFNKQDNKDVAFKVNDKVVKLKTVQTALVKGKDIYVKSYGAQLFDPNVVYPITLDGIIGSELLVELAEKSVKKSFDSELNTQLGKIKERLGGEKQFNEFLTAQGYTLDSLKDELRRNLMIQEYYRTLLASITVTEQEVAKNYSDNKAYFKDKTLAQVKNQIVEALKQKRLNEVIELKLAEAKKNAKITSVNEEIKSFLPAVAFTYEGVQVSNVEYDNVILETLGALQKKDLNEAKKIAKSKIERDIKSVVMFEKMGVKVNKLLPLKEQIKLAVPQIYTTFYNQVKVTDEQLNTYFERNRARYDIPQNVDVDLAILNVKPSADDRKVAKNKATKVLKETTPKNFAEMAKKYSDSPNGKDGGKIAPFKKGSMVKSFDEAAFTGEIGKVYPKVIETEYGNHILYIQDRKNDVVVASQILIEPKASKVTTDRAVKNVKKYVADLKAKKVTFDGLKKLNPDITVIGRVDRINANTSRLQKDFVKKLLSAKVGEVGYFAGEYNNYFIYKKIKNVPFTKAVLSQIKGKVEEDYRNEMVMRKFRALQASIDKK